jgi:hypothetical protein
MLHKLVYVDPLPENNKCNIILCELQLFTT